MGNSVIREGTQSDLETDSRRRVRSLDAGMPGTNDDDVVFRHGSLSNAKPFKNPLKEILGRALPGDLLQRGPRVL